MKANESYPETTAHLDLTVMEIHKKCKIGGKSIFDAWGEVEAAGINSMQIGLPVFDYCHQLWDLRN